MRRGVADVAIWGRVPPPIGGMAVHIDRLLPRLREAGISVQMYSVGRRTPEHPQVRQVSGMRLRWLFSLLLRECEPVHYVFSDDVLARFAAVLLALFGRAKVVLRIGGESLAASLKAKGRLHRYLVRFALRHATAVVGVNQAICELARANGAKRVLHVPGFIPPPEPVSPLPNEVAAFVRSGNAPTLLASGEIQGMGEQDLYGAYGLLDLLESLPHVKLVYYAYRITFSEDKQQELAREIAARGLKDRYLLYSSNSDLLPAMRHCDLLVRPTRSDGDANSVREALHFGLPVVASDCVARPSGVVTFRAGDREGLRSAVEGVLCDLKRYRKEVALLEKRDNALPIIALLRELLGRGETVRQNVCAE